MKTMRDILRNEERNRREREFHDEMNRNINRMNYEQEELYQATQMNNELQRQHQFFVEQNMMNPFG